MHACIDQATILRYSQGAIVAPDELPAVDEHLASCAACRERVRGEARSAAPSLAQRIRLRTDESACIGRDVLTGYLDGASDPADREIVESHTEVCRTCADNLAAIRVARAQMAACDWQHLETIAAPSRAQERLGAWLHSSRWALVGSAVAAVLAVVWATRPSVPAPSAPPRVVAELRDGPATVRLDTAGRLTGVPPLPRSLHAMVRDAFAARRAPRSLSVAALTDSAGVLLRTGANHPGFALMGPFGTAVPDGTPTLRWSAKEGTVRYRITVVDDARDQEAVHHDLALTAPEGTPVCWSVSKGVLSRGRSYRWFVVASLAGGRSVKAPGKADPRARFRVISLEEARQLAEARRLAGGSHLVLGTAYAGLGLLDDAEREFEALNAANPGSAASDALLRSVRGYRASPSTVKPAQ